VAALETTEDHTREHAERGPLEKALSIFADTHPGEGVSALLLTASVFLILLAYYLCKTAREPLILASGAELKSYASVGQTLLLIPATYLYGLLSQKVGRLALITIVTLLFVSNLLIFFGLSVAGVPIGLAFYLWVGIFSVMIIAQFWSFAADVYTEAQGKRLFAILGIGSTVGAVAGAALAGTLIKPLGVYGMMLVAAIFLLAALGLTVIVARRERRGALARAQAGTGVSAESLESPLGSKGGFALLLADRYLLLVAALSFVLNCVKTNGEYILDRSLLEHVKAITPVGVNAHAFSQVYIGTFKAHYFLYVNVATVVLQVFVVSRIIKYLGVRVALFIGPVLLLAGYSGAALAPVLGLIFGLKIAENTLDYSLGNTSRQALWLLTSRDEKYQAKSVIDAAVVRAGDALAAGVTLVGVTLHFGTVHFILVNLGLILIWTPTMWLLANEHRKREARFDAAKLAAAAGS
jgi:ATP:ADP antiporter, AAA family